MSLWNPYTFTIGGAPALLDAAPPALRVMGGGQASAEQLAAARMAFSRFCAVARTSPVPNPTETGRLPDGSAYRIVVVGAQALMELHPVVGGKPLSDEVRPGIWFLDPAPGEPGAGNAFFVLSPPGEGLEQWTLARLTGWPALPVAGRAGPRVSMATAKIMTTGIRAPEPAEYFYPNGGARLQQLGGYVSMTINAVGESAPSFVGFDENHRAMFLSGGVLSRDGLYLYRSSTSVNLDKTGAEGSGIKPQYEEPPTYPAISLTLVSEIYQPAVSTWAESNGRQLLAVASNGRRIATLFTRQFDRLPPFAGDQYTIVKGGGLMEAYTTDVSYKGTTYVRVDARTLPGVINGALTYRGVEADLKVFDTRTGEAVVAQREPSDSFVPGTPVLMWWDAASEAGAYSKSTGFGVGVDYSAPVFVLTSYSLTGTPGSYREDCTFALDGEVSHSAQGSQTTHEILGPFFSGSELLPLIAKTEKSYESSFRGHASGSIKGFGLRGGDTPPQRPEFVDEATFDAAIHTYEVSGTHAMEYKRTKNVQVGRFGELRLIDERTTETADLYWRRFIDAWTGAPESSTGNSSSAYAWSVTRRALLVFDPELDLLCYSEFGFSGSGSAAYERTGVGDDDVTYYLSPGEPLPDLPRVRIVLRCGGETKYFDTAVAEASHDYSHRVAAAQLHPMLGYPYGAPAVHTADYLEDHNAIGTSGMWTVPMVAISDAIRAFADGTPVTTALMDGVPVFGYFWRPSPNAFVAQCSTRGSFPEPSRFLEAVQATYVRSPDGRGAYLRLQCNPSIPETVRGFAPQTFVVDMRGLHTSPTTAQLASAGVDLSMAGAF